MAGSRERSGRFSPGHSGNARGRPRRKKPQVQDGSAFAVLEGRRVNIMIGGLSRALTMEEALFHRTYQDALKGSPASIRAVIKKINQREAKRSPDAHQRVVIVCECPHPEDVDEALAILGIASRCAERVRAEGAPFLQLEPWAVAAALGRQASRSMSHQQLKVVQLHTRDAASVVWPEGSE